MYLSHIDLSIPFILPPTCLPPLCRSCPLLPSSLHSYDSLNQLALPAGTLRGWRDFMLAVLFKCNDHVLSRRRHSMHPPIFRFLRAAFHFPLLCSAVHGIGIGRHFPFRTGHPTATYPQHFDQRWLSAQCKKKFPWPGSRPAVIYVHKHKYVKKFDNMFV